MYFMVALGGALGALARFQIQMRYPVDGNWPLTTWSINLLGSLFIGILYALVERNALSIELRALLVVGFLGAFTTFSAFSLELVQQLERGAWLSALGYALGSVLTCLLGAGFGLWLARQWV